MSDAANIIDVDFSRKPVYSAMGMKVARSLRGEGVWQQSGTGDIQIRGDRKELLRISRSLFLENWLYEGTVHRAADYILGPAGLIPQAKTGNPELDKRIENDIWAPYAADPEARGIYDFNELTYLVFLELVNAGDTLQVKLGKTGNPALDGKCQHIEAERIDGPTAALAREWEQGVRLTPWGSIAGFHVADVDPRSGYVQSSRGRIVPAQNAIYARGRWKRSSQTRGLPHLVSGMPIAHRLEDILTAEAISWQNLSRLAFGIDTGGAPPGGKLALRRGETTTARDDAQTADVSKAITQFGYATIVQGHEIKPIIYNRPGPNFVESVRLFVRLFGLPLGIPMEMILLDNKGLNYSSIRGLLLQAFLNFRRWQSLLVQQHCVRHWRWQVGRAVAAGRLPYTPTIFDHKWVVPTWPWVDEVKEVAAWSEKIDRMISTQTDALSALGQDLEEKRTDRKAELLRAAELAREIESEPEGIFTAAAIARHLAGFHTGDTESAFRAAMETETEDEDSPPADPPADQEDNDQ